MKITGPQVDPMSGDGQVESGRSWHASPGLALLLRLGLMVPSLFLSLFYTRELIRAMGPELYGVFASFTALVTVGGLGDLGIGGALSLQASQCLHRGETQRLAHLLPAARGLFVVLATVWLLAATVCCFRLPGWLGFAAGPGTGSLAGLFWWGGCNVALCLLASYWNNLNYAVGTLAWTLVPWFVVTQLVFMMHIVLAHRHDSLWVQYLPYLLPQILTIVGVAWYFRRTLPNLGQLLPLRLDSAIWRGLFRDGFWFSLCLSGTIIFTTTDRLLINHLLGPTAVTPYLVNYKCTDLCLTALGSLSFYFMPRIYGLLTVDDSPSRQLARDAMNTLNGYQSILVTVAASVMLVGNSIFVRYWVGPHFILEGSLQEAFAGILISTVSLDVFIQAAGRCGAGAVRRAGLLALGTGLLNVILSYAALAGHWLAGVAWATVCAQLVLSLICTRIVCREVGTSFLRSLVKSLLIPAGLTVVIALWVRIDADRTWRSLIVVPYLIGAVILLIRLHHLDPWGDFRRFRQKLSA